MPKKKIEVQEDPTEAVVVEETPIEPVAEIVVEFTQEEPTVFNVYNGNNITRTYSVEIHGIRAKSLAEEFAKKFGYQIK